MLLRANCACMPSREWERQARVNRLGELSPIRRFFSLGTFLKIAVIAKTFWRPSLDGKMLSIIFTEKWGWLYFGRFFSQTNLATMTATYAGDSCIRFFYKCELLSYSLFAKEALAKTIC
jgi:hypothetical protein